MNNPDTLNFLAHYPQEQLELAFAQLGYTIDSPEFPESIIEDVEAILDSIGEAVAQQKQLASAQVSAADSVDEPKREAITVAQTAAIAAEILDVRNVQVDQKTLFAIAQSVITRTKTQAAALNRLQRETMVAELRKGQQELTDDLLQVMKAGQEATDELFSDANLQKMVDRAVPQYQSRFDVDEFIKEIKVTTSELATEGNETVRVGTEARNTKIEFDLNAFLDEVWE